MKGICLAGLLAAIPVAARAATTELEGGPNVSVEYDSELWRAFLPVKESESGSLRGMYWKLQEGGVQVYVGSSPERWDAATFKRKSLNQAKFLGDPPTLVGERRESIAGQEWSVLEFHNARTRPPRSVISYFLPREDGHVHFQVVADEAKLPTHREAVNAFLAKMKVE